MRNHLERTQPNLHSIHQSLQIRSSKHGIPNSGYKTCSRFKYQISTRDKEPDKSTMETRRQSHRSNQRLKQQVFVQTAHGWMNLSSHLPSLKMQARASGEEVKIAEVLTLAGIKHSELEEQFHRYKGPHSV